MTKQIFYFPVCDRLLFNVIRVMCFAGFQICFAGRRSRHAAERVPRIPKYYAEEGMVSRELLTLSKSGVWIRGEATARGVGGTCEFGEGKLRNKYKAT